MFLTHVFMLCTPETLANKNVKSLLTETLLFKFLTSTLFCFLFCFDTLFKIFSPHTFFFIYIYTYNIHIYLYRSHISLVTQNVCVGFVESDRVRVRAKKT